MYKKDLKKLEVKTLRKLVRSLKRSRDASQAIVDATQGVLKQGQGRKELQQHLRWYERQLNKAEEVLTMKLEKGYLSGAIKRPKKAVNRRRKT